MDTPLEECERRDVKGLYKKARAGIIRGIVIPPPPPPSPPHSLIHTHTHTHTHSHTGFTGIDAAYEPPENPDLVIKAGEESVDECVEKLVNFLQEQVTQGYMYCMYLA